MAFSASDDFIGWAQSLSGLLTTIRTEYGSMPEMVENSRWDEGRTHLALSLVKSLRAQLIKIEKELAQHVIEKYGTVDG